MGETRPKLLLTGATGFVGLAVRPVLDQAGWSVVPVVRQPGLPGALIVPDATASAAWSGPLAGVSAVVHLAARVHVMKEDADDQEALFRSANTDATLNLARAAASAGVRRFVFMSTAKVYGSGRDAPYGEADLPVPADSYARSKYAAERGLLQIAAETAMEVAIVRPPLIYGPGVKANFLSLLRAVDQGLPLPLGAVDNRRSLISTANLASVLVVGLSHPAATGHAFAVSDGEDVSTPDLVRRMAAALGRSVRLVPVPVPVLAAGAALVGKSDAFRRLAGSFALDTSAIRQVLDWRPQQSLDEGLAEVALWYRSR